jgi:hypothetical protein
MNIRLARKGLVWHKSSNLFLKSVNYGGKLFYNIGPKPERLSGDKGLSVFSLSVSDEEKKGLTTMTPERGVDAVEQSCRRVPVDGVVHLDALVDLAEELVDATNDGGQSRTESLLGPVGLRKDLWSML